MSRSAPTLAALVLIAIGIALMVEPDLILKRFAGFVHWSLYIITPGVVLTLAGLAAQDHARALTTLGLVTLSTGLVLAYQDWAQHYQSWAYAWILVGPVATGLAWHLAGVATDDQAARDDGRPLIVFGLMGFAAAAAFFELIVGISGHGILSNLRWSTVLGLLLIAVGLAVAISSRVRAAARHSSKNGKTDV